MVLKNAGEISPTSAEEYVGVGGYLGLKKALEAPEKVVDTIKESGLRGRGGASFPTGLKLSFTANTPAPQKYIVANADEGEPGTCKDRVIMEDVPHRLLEGMAVAGVGVGATKGYIYLRAEYSSIGIILNEAILDARKNGYLGQDLFGSGIDFDIEVTLGAGSYVCGEETALLDSMEGKRGEPRYKPPYPGISGLWGLPSVVNNIETLANLPAIMVEGPQWFRSIGTDKCPGTKLFTLSGNINNPGIYEFPTGTTVKHLFLNVGGGCPGGKELIAVQTGGASGNIIPPSLLDTPMAPEFCDEAGATFGPGDLMFIDEDYCLLDVVENLLEFFEDESCGKCTPCREGTPRLLALINKFRDNTAEEGDTDIIRDISNLMMGSSLCGLGQASPNAIMSLLKFFPQEFAISKRRST